MDQNFSKFIKHLFLGSIIINGPLYIYVKLFLDITFIKGSGEYYFFLNMGIAILIELIVVYALFSAFKLIGYHAIIYAILGGLIIGSLTLRISQIAIWFVPIGDSVFIVTGTLGLIYGSTIFPIILKPNFSTKQ